MTELQKTVFSNRLNFIRLGAIFCFCLLLGNTLSAQTAHKSLRYGDNAYVEGDYSDAEINYRRALEKKNAAKSKYNLGNAIYKQGRYEEAIPQFEAAASSSLDPEMRANSFYNLGNAYFEKQEYEKSVEAYKNSLRIAPDDLDTKKNLSRAMRRVQQEQQQQQQQQDQQDQNKEKNEENQDQQEQQDQQDNQQPQDQEQEEQQPQDQDQEGKEQDEQKEQDAQPQERDMNKEEAKKLLQVMDEEERKVQEKMRKMKGKKTVTGKDW